MKAMLLDQAISMRFSTASTDQMIKNLAAMKNAYEQGAAGETFANYWMRAGMGALPELSSLLPNIWGVGVSQLLRLGANSLGKPWLSERTATYGFEFQQNYDRFSPNQDTVIPALVKYFDATYAQSNDLERRRFFNRVMDLLGINLRSDDSAGALADRFPVVRDQFEELEISTGDQSTEIRLAALEQASVEVYDGTNAIIVSSPKAIG